MKRLYSAILVATSPEQVDVGKLRATIAELRTAAGERTVLDVTLVAGASPQTVGVVKALERTVVDFDATIFARHPRFLEGALAGIETSIGERIFVFDLSEVSPDLAAALIAGSGDVVLARTDSSRLATPLRLASGLAACLTGYRDQEFLNSFAVSRNAAPTCLECDLDPEMFRSMIAGLGLAVEEVLSDLPRRRLSVRRTLAYAATRWMERSDMALRTATTLGLLMAGLNLAYALWVVGANLLLANVADGWTTLSLQQSAMFFIMSLVLVLVGESVVRLGRHDMTSRSRVVYRGRSTERTRDEILNLG